MKKLLIVFCLLSVVRLVAQDRDNTEITINQQLEDWHKAAADADFDACFKLMTDDAVFIGTDAEENWQLAEFKAYAKPHFDRGKA